MVMSARIISVFASLVVALMAALPADLAQQVSDQGTWGYDELVALADRCNDIKTQREVSHD